MLFEYIDNQFLPQISKSRKPCAKLESQDASAQYTPRLILPQHFLQ